MYCSRIDRIGAVFASATGFSPRNAEISDAGFVPNTHQTQVVALCQVTAPQSTWSVKECSSGTTTSRHVHLPHLAGRTGRLGQLRVLPGPPSDRPSNDAGAQARAPSTRAYGHLFPWDAVSELMPDALPPAGSVRGDRCCASTGRP